MCDCSCFMEIFKFFRQKFLKTIIYIPKSHPSECFQHGGLLPLGGTEDSGGYKGYGLGMMVEILCGILGGGNYSSNIRRWAFAVPGEDPANLGHCFIAIDPECFA